MTFNYSAVFYLKAFPFPRPSDPEPSSIGSRNRASELPQENRPDDGPGRHIRTESGGENGSLPRKTATCPPSRSVTFESAWSGTKSENPGGRVENGIPGNRPPCNEAGGRGEPLSKPHKTIKPEGSRITIRYTGPAALCAPHRLSAKDGPQDANTQCGSDPPKGIIFSSGLHHDGAGPIYFIHDNTCRYDLLYLLAPYSVSFKPFLCQYDSCGNTTSRCIDGCGPFSGLSDEDGLERGTRCRAGNRIDEEGFLRDPDGISPKEIDGA